MRVAGVEAELVEEVVRLPGRAISLLRPRDAEALLDEEAFEREEFLPYWAELWPSAVALASVLEDEPLAGRAIVELGCGLGLPSIVAALRGARVLAVDWSAEALAATAANARRNGARVETLLCSWAAAGALEARGPWELVLASDVLYERRDAGFLLPLLPRLVAPGGEALLAGPGRPAEDELIAAARSAWRIETIAPGPGCRVRVRRLRRR